MNALLGERLSIITNKPQTTRKRILGITSGENYQVIFLDTPGILNPSYTLQEKFIDHVNYAVSDADLLLVMIDMENDSNGKKTFNDELVSKILREHPVPKICLLNKIDLSSEKIVNDLMEKAAGFDEVIPLSAKEGYNIDKVFHTVLDLLPEGPKFYPDDQLTDENERFFVAEIIREKIFELYKDEVPYSVEVLIDEFKEREKGKDYISASIVVERDSQKPIIIGKRGEYIKKLGKVAREAIDDFLQRPVYLELFVKVRKKWRNNPGMLKSFGYDIPKD